MMQLAIGAMMCLIVVAMAVFLTLIAVNVVLFHKLRSSIPQQPVSYSGSKSPSEKSSSPNSRHSDAIPQTLPNNRSICQKSRNASARKVKFYLALKTITFAPC